MTEIARDADARCVQHHGEPSQSRIVNRASGDGDGRRVSVSIREFGVTARCREPVTMGLPFPRGLVDDVTQLVLFEPGGQRVPLQAETLDRWIDGSVRWVLLDFEVDLAAGETADYEVTVLPSASPPLTSPGIRVDEEAGGFSIDTGPARFTIERPLFGPVSRAVVGGTSLLDPQGALWQVIDGAGVSYRARLGRLACETQGPVRTTFIAEGQFVAPRRRSLCEFFARVSFFMGTSTVRVEMTLRNPRRARHRRNLWDLGDRGSIYVRDASLKLTLARPVRSIAWSMETGEPWREERPDRLEIYQDSSGGDRWNSVNHVDRHGEVSTVFQGYRVRHGDDERRGKRAEPLVAIRSEEGAVAVAVRQFWQNFPKAIEAHGSSLMIRLFPHQARVVHELQGGEQKTHVVYLVFAGPSEDLRPLAWVRSPLVPHAPPDWYAASQAVPYLTPRSLDTNTEYLRLVEAAVEGADSFAGKREVIDEYGWRHFGDMYADHEGLHYRGQPPVISHYNNQYDAINGAFLQFIRSSDTRWFEMMDELALHVVDVDVYHTRKDRPAYSGGMFWHTSHYVSAGTGTHRTFSRRSVTAGGGPSNEHCYTTGLMHHYLLTGNRRSRDTVLELAQWVIDIDDGTLTMLRWIDPGDTGAASATVDRSYHGPGRGAANAVNALLDGYSLSGDVRCLAKAEALIRRCIHPHDEVEARELLDAERRWSYTVFLQTLGKYLDLKANRGEIDLMYGYAQASLLRYARWMATHEVPYLSRPEGLEYPTETWSAQDMRKSCVFHFAAKHAPDPERGTFLERADFFFGVSVDELSNSATRTFTRPVVLLMTNGLMKSYFDLLPEHRAPTGPPIDDTSRPKCFMTQRDRLFRALKRFLGLEAAAAIAALVRDSVRPEAEPR